ncbi:hypothetical protein ACQ86N_21385 [Puia sp. P3]|uniref:hypothetical protein n=1 Tax=Puia sp. P3 TaxID=3423952 RepID=UPI003D676E60
MNNFHKYLAITELEETWGFYVTTVGYSRIEANQDYPHNQGHPLTHSFSWNKGRILNGYYLVFISKGKGVFESALSLSAEVEAGTCFFLFQGYGTVINPTRNRGGRNTGSVSGAAIPMSS